MHLLLNNVVASNAPIQLNKERWHNVLSEYQIDGESVFDLQTDQGQSDLEYTVSILDNFDILEVDNSRRLWSKYVALEDKGYNHPKSLKAKDQRIITDNNLGHEFPYLPTLPWKNLQ